MNSSNGQQHSKETLVFIQFHFLDKVMFLIEPPRQKQLAQRDRCLFFPLFFVLESRLIKSRFIPTANAPTRDRLLQPLRKSFINQDPTSTTSRLADALVAGFAPDRCGSWVAY